MIHVGSVWSHTSLKVEPSPAIARDPDHGRGSHGHGGSPSVAAESVGGQESSRGGASLDAGRTWDTDSLLGT